MCLSINRLSVDQGHKKQRAGQDWEIQDHVEFAKKKKKTLIYSFIIFASTPVSRYYSFFIPSRHGCISDASLRFLTQRLKDVSDRADLQISETSVMRPIKDVSSEMSHFF